MKANAAPAFSRARANAALALLMLGAFTALLDRYLISILVDPIRQRFGVGDTEVSLLQGLAFAMFYSMLGLPFGRLVDRSNRRNILLAGLLTWTSMTILCGLAPSFFWLFLGRVGVGVGEACLAPAAYSLITDYFEPRMHGRALASYTISTTIGGGASFAVGAWALALAQRLSAGHGPLSGLEPWRLTFLIVGSPGLVIAAMLLLLREPARRGGPVRAGTTRWADLGHFLARIKKPLSLFLASSACASITAVSLIGWAAVYLSRTLAVPVTRGGVYIGIVMITNVLVSGPIAGWLADTALIRRSKGAKLLIAPLGCTLAIGPVVGFTLAPTAPVALIFFFLYSFAANMQSCAAPAIMQDILPNRFKGQVSALYWMVIALLGYGGGPTLVALITDYGFHNPAMLRYSMLIVGVSGLVLATLFALLARESYDRALRATVVETGAAEIGAA